MASVQGFDFFARCTTSGVRFQATNTTIDNASLYQELAGDPPTLVVIPAAGSSAQTAAATPAHVTFMAPPATNAFVVEMWGAQTDTNKCHAAAVRTSEVPN
jgi:hypothetical protein